VLFNRRVVNPLKQLNQSALDISAGNFHQRGALIEGWDEMRQLGDRPSMSWWNSLNASNLERDKAEDNLLQLNQELEQ
jgi:two-component system sensor histidine kinase/response regulator